jgi:hypothetical protein
MPTMLMVRAWFVEFAMAYAAAAGRRNDVVDVIERSRYLDRNVFRSACRSNRSF